MKKLIRITTVDISLNSLLIGQLRYLSQFYEVVGLASDTGVLDSVGKREGIRVINIPMQRDISLLSDIKSLWNMYRTFRKEKPDIIHSNTPKGSLLAMIAGWATHVPHRIYLVTGLRYQGASGIKRAILKTMERISCRFATKIIPEGEGVKRILTEDGITHKPMKVIHHGNINGKDTSYYSPEATIKAHGSRDSIRKSLGYSSEDFVFVFVGRVVKDKGMNELTNCMKRLKKDYPHLRLMLVGRIEDKLDPILPENINYLQTDSAVNFLGLQKDVRPYYLAADALIFPSYREGFPNVVIEAGALSLPSLVTDISGCNEIIEDNVNGKIIPPKSEEALYEMMKYFMDNRDAVREMASRSRKLVQERFEQKDLWEELRKMYESLEDFSK